MKYLKMFKESFESNSKEIIYNCENLLLGLSDNGYTVKVTYDRGIDDSDILSIIIYKQKLRGGHYVTTLFSSNDIIEYINTINDYLSIDYNYDFTSYGGGYEYNDISSFEESNTESTRFSIFFEFK